MENDLLDAVFPFCSFVLVFKTLLDSWKDSTKEYYKDKS